MIVFIKKNLSALALIFGSLSVYAIYLIVADPPGYCAAQQRYISDEEFIQIAIQREKTSMNIDGSEESIRTFHAKNPDCCRVDRNQTQYFARFLSTTVNSVEVYLQYEMSAAKVARYPANKYYDASVILDECGKELDTYGMPKEDCYHFPKAKKEQS